MSAASCNYVRIIKGYLLFESNSSSVAELLCKGYFIYA